jgi:hypothetical protein
MKIARRCVVILLLTACVCLVPALAMDKYEVVPAGPPPAELAPAIRAALQQDGIKITTSESNLICEIWFRATAPSGPPATERSVTLTTIPHGALLGAIRFPGRALDRRGQPIKGGVYTLRLSYFPPNGNHQGISPNRDFFLMSAAADDTDLNATPKFDDLVKMSAKVTGTNHPASLSAWKADAGQAAAFVEEGEGDWVLYTKIGDTMIGVILIGTYHG